MSTFSQIVPKNALIRDFYAHSRFAKSFKSLELPKNCAIMPKNCANTAENTLKIAKTA